MTESSHHHREAPSLGRRRSPSPPPPPRQLLGQQLLLKDDDEGEESSVAAASSLLDDHAETNQELREEEEVEIVDEEEAAIPPVEGPAILTDDLRDEIVRQVEYYFSDENLPADKYMLQHVKKGKLGFVPIVVIASFRRMKRLVRDLALIEAALRTSSKLVVSKDGRKVRRLHPLPGTETKDNKLCTVMVEIFPDDYSMEHLQKIFGNMGKILNITIHDPCSTEESKAAGKNEKAFSNKLHALIEYETTEAAANAVATLNDQKNWRSGMRVEILPKWMQHSKLQQPTSTSNTNSKHPEQNRIEEEEEEEERQQFQHRQQQRRRQQQRLQQQLEEERSCITRNLFTCGRFKSRTASYGLIGRRCKEKFSDKSGHSHLSEIALDGPNSKSDEHHLDKAKKEEEEHYAGGKGRHRDHYKNRGRGQQNARGQGHGQVPSASSNGVSKPPPGPRMPDGTRGFTVGRGKPFISGPNQVGT